MAGLDAWVTKEDNYNYDYDKNFIVIHAGQYKSIKKDWTFQQKLQKYPYTYVN